MEIIRDDENVAKKGKPRLFGLKRLAHAGTRRQNTHTLVIAKGREFIAYLSISSFT